MLANKKLFIKFFLLMYIANTAATAVSYSFFYLSKSLAMMNVSVTFTVIAIDISRFVLLVYMFSIRKYSDTFSKNTMANLGGILGAIAFLGLAFSTGSVWILLFCMLYGISVSSMSYLSAMMFDRTSPETRMKIFGLFATSFSVASLVGAWVSEFLYPIGTHGVVDLAFFPSMDTWGFLNPLNFHTDVNPSFMLLSGFLLCIVWLVSSITANYYGKKLPFYGAASQADKDYKPKFFDYKTPMPMIWFVGVIWMSLMSFIATYTTSLGLTTSTLFFTGFAICALLARFVIMPYIKLLGRNTVIYISFSCYLLCIAGLLILHYYTSQWLLLLCGMIFGAGHGVIYTLLNIVFTEITPKHTGNANFVFIIIFQIGCLSSLLIGILIDYLGYTAIFSILLASATGYLLLSKRNPLLQKLLQG